MFVTMVSSIDVRIREKLSEYLTPEQVEDVMRTIDEVLDEIKSEQAAMRTDLNSTKSKLTAVEKKVGLMSVPYNLNVSNELCRLVEIALSQEYTKRFGGPSYRDHLTNHANRVVTYMSRYTAFQVNPQPGRPSLIDEMVRMRSKRNRMIHDLQYLTKQMATFDEEILKDFVSSVSVTSQFGAEILSNVSPILFFLITSEAVQRCKYDLLKKVQGTTSVTQLNLTWTQGESESALTHLVNTASDSNIGLGLSKKNLKKLFSKFETREFVNNNRVRLVEPFSRSDIIDLYDSWSRSAVAHSTIPLDAEVEALWIHLPDLMKIAAGWCRLSTSSNKLESEVDQVNNASKDGSPVAVQESQIFIGFRQKASISYSISVHPIVHRIKKSFLLRDMRWTRNPAQKIYVYSLKVLDRKVLLGMLCQRV